MAIKRVRLFGLSSYIPDAPFLSTEDFIKKYGANNGNFVYSYALSQILDISPIAISWNERSKDKFSEVDILVMTLANQLGPHTDLLKAAEFLSEINLPVVGVGLGIQYPYNLLKKSITPSDISDGTWQWFNQITEHSKEGVPNISLRGNSTYDLLTKVNKQNHCVVTGCPSNFINPSVNLGEEISKKEIPENPRFAVSAGNPVRPQFNLIEKSLINLINASDGLYICQNPEIMIRLSRQDLNNVSKEDFLSAKKFISPELTDEDFIKWFKFKSYIFSSVPEWIDTLKHFDVVVGTRIHGTMTGIQAGIPSLCICIDLRTLELCQIMHIPHIDSRNCMNGVSKEDIINTLKNWDWKKYDSTRKELANKLLKLFQDNDITVADYFKKITEQ
ncbi:MAG: polysaccharide pyruvyl transferase family protein [Candidatus Paceibacterota bacterium]